MKTVEECGKVYKLNKNKCESLTMRKQLSQALKDGYKLKWDTKKIKYLGISISENPDELYENNYGVLEIKIR